MMYLFEEVYFFCYVQILHKYIRSKFNKMLYQRTFRVPMMMAHFPNNNATKNRDGAAPRLPSNFPFAAPNFTRLVYAHVASITSLLCEREEERERERKRRKHLKREYHRFIKFGR